ncbi:MAG: aromatic ring-hydroxylating dioxygenase subunit alpha, partial [Pseudomonadota bacterium]
NKISSLHSPQRGPLLELAIYSAQINSVETPLDLFSPSHYRSVRRPLLEAETLPAACYTDPAFYAREVERLFAPQWELAGRIDEVPNPGDVIVLDSAAGSTLVVRAADGELRAFANSCRHRGTRLQDCSANQSRLICPYHSWVFGLDGSLQTAPGMQNAVGFSKEDFALEQRRLDVWGGFIFVNQNADAPDLLCTLGNLPEVVRDHPLDALRCTRRVEFDVASNWKLLIENALEAYHTGTVHRATLGAQPSSPVDARGDWDALYVPSDPDKSIATMPGELQSFPFFANLQGMPAAGTFFTVLYPCTQIVFAQDCVWWMDILPTAVDRSKVVLGSCFLDSVIAQPDFRERVEPYYHRWDSATPEDNAIAEAQQRGQAAGVKLRGRFSEREHCVHKLANWVLDRVLDTS